VLLAAALATGQPGPVLAATPVTHVTATAAMAAPGTNFLLNPEATAGVTSAQGWDAVTIPGWQVAGGLPTVVRYGTPGFPKTAKSWPGNRGNLFAGGAGGTGKLVQQTSVTPNARYDIAGWLGGTKTSAAELTVQFTRKRANSRDRRDRARRETGEARARLPASGRHGSRSQVIGNTKQAPYLNSLRRGGATLTNFYAEEHPSDANYLALAGGSAFGVPLTVRRHRARLLLNDDQPMMYSQDVRDRPPYCARHVVPLEELGNDLANPATTPNFAWVAPDDWVPSPPMTVTPSR